MGRFILAGEPAFGGDTLYWGGTLDPGTFEQVSAGSSTDTVDVFRMTADNAAGLDPTSDFLGQYEVPLPMDVMPGDSYQSHLSLALPYGYYHLQLTIDDGETYQLHVRVEDGTYDLKSWSRA